MPPANDPKHAADLNAIVQGLIWAAGHAAALDTPPGYAAARALFADAAALNREPARAAAGPGGFPRPAPRPEMTEEQWLAAYAPKRETPV